MREDNQKRNDLNKGYSVVRKAYHIVMICLYQLTGIYFIWFSTYSEAHGAPLPSWVYITFGCLMIIYSFNRIYRMYTGSRKEKQ